MIRGLYYQREVMSTSPKAIEIAERRVKVLKLRKEGWTYEKIGNELSISDDTARNDCLEAIRSIEWTAEEAAMEVRELVKHRNDELINSLYEKALNGDYGAVDRIIKINEQLLEIVGGKITRHDITSGGGKIGAAITTVEVILDVDGTAHKSIIDGSLVAETES